MGDTALFSFLNGVICGILFTYQILDFTTYLVPIFENLVLRLKNRGYRNDEAMIFLNFFKNVLLGCVASGSNNHPFQLWFVYIRRKHDDGNYNGRLTVLISTCKKFFKKFEPMRKILKKGMQKSKCFLFLTFRDTSNFYQTSRRTKLYFIEKVVDIFR